MRIAAVIFLVLCTSAKANPLAIAQAAADRIYMSSERLTVSISQDTAELRGTFAFQYRHDVWAPGQKSFVLLEIPIWFPEQDTKDSTVTEFWREFPKNQLLDITPKTKEAFQKALALRVRLGDESLEVKQLSSFCTRNNRASWAQEPGFCCIVLRIYINDDSTLVQKPLNLSYRQPLLHTNEEAEFFYLPVFENLPSGTVTTDTNRYSVTVVADGGVCLAVSDWQQTATLAGGRSLTLSPRHHQGIRAVARPRANESVQRTGASRSAQETNPTSSAAGSRR